MPNPIYTKKDLYHVVDTVRSKSGIEFSQTQEPFSALCPHLGYGEFDVEPITLSSRSIRGIACTGDRIILLNNKRNEVEQNFDCAHEFYHILLHNTADHATFKCFDYEHPKQDPGLEWQENESSAESLVPYRVFIPRFTALVLQCYSQYNYQVLLEYLASKYHVPVTVIQFRVENLKYEIHQYINGVPIEKLDIRSLSSQERNGIYIPSFNDRFQIKKAPYLAPTK